jgi:hypothetical protein
MNISPLEQAILLGLVWTAFISLVLVVIVYGFLTPWWKSRTGIGFMSTKLAFLTAIGLSLMRAYGYHFPVWVAYAAWVFIILAMNLGITWNIIYKQFFQHRGDEVADKSTDHPIQEGVKSSVMTGPIPIHHQGDESDR